MQGFTEPEPVEVNMDALLENFKAGFRHFGVLWKEVFSPECLPGDREDRIEKARLLVPCEIWVKILYELAATFHSWKKNRYKLIELVEPLYYARVASFVNQSRDMDSHQAEELVEQQARCFEENKSYLMSIWDERAEARGLRGIGFLYSSNLKRKFMKPSCSCVL